MSSPSPPPAPNKDKRLELRLETLKDTAQLGEALSDQLAAGQVLALSGELGAGKTSLARALIRARAKAPDLEVPSPSFALVQPYDLPEGNIVHADLYRLEASLDLEELGLMDDPEALVIVEWAEKAAELVAAADLVITLGADPATGVRTARLDVLGGPFDLGKLAARLAPLVVSPERRE